MKKICVVTSARSEYGLLRWLMEEIKNDPFLKLQLVVAGSHLSSEFGYTYREIEKDGFVIDEKIEFLISSNTKKSLAKSMGVCGISIADAFEKLKPDIIVVLGDRYELLPICSTALVMNIPIAHISGGDITKGAIDDQVRNAITQLATLHFPGTKESANRIIKMGIDPKKVFAVGEPGLDNFLRLPKLKKEEIAERLGLDDKLKWIILTYHPETKISLKKNMEIIKNIIKVLSNLKNVQIVMTKANADFGGLQINEYLTEVSQKQNNFMLFDNLGQENYINILRYAWFMIGNSSSGIVESPIIKLPVINIGQRQKGRFFCKNVINSNGSVNSLKKMITILTSSKFSALLKNLQTPYGKGKTAMKIKDVLVSIELDK
jgi:UDP-N-acetylglucosamine 2-epimerase (non-hydrolysing)